MSGNRSLSELSPLTAPSYDESSLGYSPLKMISPKAEVSSPDMVEYVPPHIHRQEGVTPLQLSGLKPYVPPWIYRRGVAPLKPSDLMPVLPPQNHREKGMSLLPSSDLMPCFNNKMYQLERVDPSQLFDPMSHIPSRINRQRVVPIGTHGPDAWHRISDFIGIRRRNNREEKMLLRVVMKKQKCLSDASSRSEESSAK